MKAKRGRKKDKVNSPEIGKWLKRYFEKRTCRYFKHEYFSDEEFLVSKTSKP